MRTSFLFVLVVAAASQLGATGGGCDQPIIRDPGFDLWCGDQLCTWKVVTGQIRKGPTWHSQDAGVEFLGSDASIEQTSPVDSGDGSCIKFDLVANVEDTVEMRLQVDVQADGSIDLDERIPTSSWKPLTYNIRLDGAYRGARFVLAKRGTGKATLAQLAATMQPATDCAGFAPVSVAPAPLGAWCDDVADCASGLCAQIPDPSSLFGTARVCVGCTAEAPCGGGQVCGLFEPSSFVRTMVPACAPEASDQLGERCAADAECASGICSNNVCSECDGARACANGGSCRLAYANGPTTCTGGAQGEPCAIDSDCTSGQCGGPERKQCADGRGCASPETCPVTDESTLEPGACTLVGVQGGTCL